MANTICDCIYSFKTMSRCNLLTVTFDHFTAKTYHCVVLCEVKIFISSSGGLAIRAFGQCPVGRSAGVKSGPLGWAKITTE